MDKVIGPNRVRHEGRVPRKPLPRVTTQKKTRRKGSRKWAAGPRPPIPAKVSEKRTRSRKTLKQKQDDESESTKQSEISANITKKEDSEMEPDEASKLKKDEDKRKESSEEDLQEDAPNSPGSEEDKEESSELEGELEEDIQTEEDVESESSEFEEQTPRKKRKYKRGSKKSLQQNRKRSKKDEGPTSDKTGGEESEKTDVKRKTPKRRPRSSKKQATEGKYDNENAKNKKTLNKSHLDYCHLTAPTLVIRAACLSTMKRLRLRQSDLANAIELSSPVLSQLLMDKYHMSSTPGHYLKLAKWVFEKDLKLVNMVKALTEGKKISPETLCQEIYQTIPKFKGIENVELDEKKDGTEETKATQNKDKEQEKDDQVSALNFSKQLELWQQFKLSLADRIKIDPYVVRWLNNRDKEEKKWLKSIENDDGASVFSETDSEGERPGKRSQRRRRSGDEFLQQGSKRRRSAADRTRHSLPCNGIENRIRVLNGPKRLSRKDLTSDYWRIKWANLSLDSNWHPSKPQTRASSENRTLSFGGKSFKLNVREASNWQKVELKTEHPLQKDMIGAPDLTCFVNSGHSIRQLEWCPVGDSTRFPWLCRQYLAVSITPPEHQFVECHRTYTGENVIQIWDMGIPLSNSTPRFVLGLVHHGGLVWDMQWYPDSCWEPCSESKESPARLGVLAVSFGDGSLRVFSIPQPDDVQSSFSTESVVKSSSPIYLKLFSLPSVALSVPEFVATALAWSPINPQSSGDRMLLAGSSTGTVALWNLPHLEASMSLRKSDSPDVKLFGPVFHQPAHISPFPIRALVWNPSNSYQFATSGQDGYVHVWDLRDPCDALVSIKISAEPVLNLHWCEKDERLLFVTERQQMKMLTLVLASGHKQTVARTRVYAPLNMLPVDDFVVPWSISVLSTKPDNILFTAIAYSDGRVDAGACNVADTWIPVKGGIVSRSLSVTRIQSVSSDSGSKQSEPVECLQFSDGYPPAVFWGRDKWREIVRERAKYMDEFAPSISRPDLALDKTLAIQAVRINPNIYFPLWIASGGLAGIVRSQIIERL